MTEWKITNPSGLGTSSFSELGITNAKAAFSVMRASTFSATVSRQFDSSGTWWPADSLVTIYRNNLPYFRGRVLETPISASDMDESRDLQLIDAWEDLETIIYQEPWAIGSGSVNYPRCILGRDNAGEPITSGAQIGEVVDYAISQGADMQTGLIDAGLQLWPSEARNISCESIIVDEMRFTPDWVAWIDHSTTPPTFSARQKSNLTGLTIDIAEDAVSANFAKSVRSVPNGVRIIYESASTIDGVVYRNAYLDEAGDTTGRKVIQTMLDLEGVDMQFQKSRIETRKIATTKEEAVAYLKAKYPELAEIPDAALVVTRWERSLAGLEAQPDPVSPKAKRLSVDDVDDLPRELVRGTIEDWIRKKVGIVTIAYDLAIAPGGTDRQQEIAANFAGIGKSFSVTATNATTKLYTGLTSFTEGEGRPIGLASAIYAAATEQQYEGNVRLVMDEIPATRFHGKSLNLVNGISSVMPSSIVHTATMDFDSGEINVEFGPLPYLSPDDFLELERMFKRRPVTWMSKEERTSNQLGATESAGSQGDTVSGYDFPMTQTVPGGGGGGAEVTGPFCEVYQDSGSWILRGGIVSGGTGNKTVSDITLGTVSSPPSNGNIQWLKVSFKAAEEDGVLMPGGNVTDVTAPAQSTSLPSNQIPTIGTTTGHVIIPLGIWQEGEFRPYRCGNFQILHCPGSLTYSRV